MAKDKPRPLGCLITSALTVIIGIILLITASIYTNETSYIKSLNNQIYSLSIFSVVIGLLSIIVGAGLIYVVCKEYPALTALFSGFLIFVAFLAVVAGVVLSTGRADFGDNTYNKTELVFKNYSDSSAGVSSKTLVGEIQQALHCCGLNRPESWKDAFPDKKSVPDSCCLIITPNCGKNVLGTDGKDNSRDIFKFGCEKPIHDNLAEKYNSLIAMNFIIMVLALVSAILGIIYERYVREHYQEL